MFSWVIPFIVVLGVLIFVHEFGHFIVAKLLGVRVEKFSLGFGPKIFGFTKGDTEYRLSLLPLGGYVKLAGEEPGENEEEVLDEMNQAKAEGRWESLPLGAKAYFDSAHFSINLAVYHSGKSQQWAKLDNTVRVSVTVLQNSPVAAAQFFETCSVGPDVAEEDGVVRH